MTAGALNSRSTDRKVARGPPNDRRWARWTRVQESQLGWGVRLADAAQKAGVDELDVAVAVVQTGVHTVAPPMPCELGKELGIRFDTDPVPLVIGLQEKSVAGTAAVSSTRIEEVAVALALE